jgi:DNA-binding NtrC family response regulator
MGTQVLLVDNDAARSNRRRNDLAAAGVEVISAFEEQQAAEAMKSDRVDIICIDSKFVTNRGPGIGALIERRMSTTPVVLIVDEAQIPGQLQKHADVIVDREDFPRMGKRLMQQLSRGQVPFFQRWFCAWVNRASQPNRGESIPPC